MPTESESDEAGPSRTHPRDVRRSTSAKDASQRDETAAESTAKSQDHDHGEDDLSWYMEQFDEHVRSTIRHRDGQGHDDSSKRSHPISMPGWTAETQSRFFAAVSRHSRLRADLIAMEIDLPESEVMAYLDGLDEGLAKVVWRVESGADGTRPKVTGSKRRRVFEAGRSHSAREVSEDWIAKEEEMSRRLDELCKQRDRANEELELAKRRKADSSAIKRELTTTITDRAERNRIKTQKLEELDRYWTREDWGKSLDSIKLLQLDKLTKPSWSEWYSRRVHGQGPVRYSSAPPSDDGLGPSHQLSSTIPRETTGKLSKHAKIAIDNAALESLVAIEKAARTPEQRAEIAKLQNRKRNRDNARLDKLTQQGLSRAEIEAKGGVDSAYLISIGKSVDDERLGSGQLRNNPHSRLSSPQKRTQSLRPGIDRTLRAMTGTTISEEGAAVEDLRRIGIFQTISEASLDVINFQQLANLCAKNVEISLQTMQDAHCNMKSFTKTLVLSAILIAESERAQCGGDIELGVDHVRRAMASVSTAQLGLADLMIDNERGADGSLSDELDGDDSDAHEMTDEEDLELDVHLDALDEALDQHLERRLYESAGCDRPSDQTPTKDIDVTQKGMWRQRGTPHFEDRS